jgi:hypothetical protein
MTDTQPRLINRIRSDIPEIMILSGSVRLPPHPVTLFQVELTAGGSADATLAVSSGPNRDPMLTLEVRAGGSARFVPAAPAYCFDRMQIDITGMDAVGTVAFR